MFFEKILEQLLSEKGVDILNIIMKNWLIIPQLG